jgi:hypothetical protein
MRHLPMPLVIALAGCASHKTPSEGDPMSSRTSEASVPKDATQARPAPERRVEKIPPLAPAHGPSRLAFAGDRLAQLVGDGVVLRSGPTLAASVKVPLSEPQGMTGLADGSVVVVHTPGDGRKLCRIAAKQTAIADCHPTEIGELGRLTFVGAAAKDEVWLRAPTRGQPLGRWRIPPRGGPLEAVQQVPVIDDAYDTLVALGDGRCAYTDGYNVYVVAAERQRFAGTAQAIELIARAHEADMVWIASEELGLRLVKLTDPLTIVIDLPPAAKTQPIALAGDGQHVAVLWTNVQNLARPASTLRVYGSDGKVVLEAVPPWQPADRYQARLASLALAGDRVALGGPAHLTVWDVPGGRVLLDEK